MLITWRPLRTIWIRRCHSSDAEDMPNGRLVHLYEPHGVYMVVIRDDRNVREMFWKACLMSIMVMYFMPCKL